MEGGVHRDLIHQSNDEVRDVYMQDLGITVVRFENQEIFEDEERVIEEFPQYPAVTDYADLRNEFCKASLRDLSPT